MIRSIQDAVELRAELNALLREAERTADYEEYDANYYDALHTFAIAVAEGILPTAYAPRVARILTAAEWAPVGEPAKPAAPSEPSC